MRVLFLCTGNSARSQMAEAIARHLGRSIGVEASSAGTKPCKQVHPLALATLAEMRVDCSGLRPKHVGELAGQRFDYVITVCDFAREICPRFPGAAATHWGFKDPAEEPEDQREQAFANVALHLWFRIPVLLDYDKLHRAEAHRSGRDLTHELLRFATRQGAPERGDPKTET